MNLKCVCIHRGRHSNSRRFVLHFTCSMCSMLWALVRSLLCVAKQNILLQPEITMHIAYTKYIILFIFFVRFHIKWRKPHGSVAHAAFLVDLLLCSLPLALWLFYSRVCLCRTAVENTICEASLAQNQRTKFIAEHSPQLGRTQQRTYNSVYCKRKVIVLTRFFCFVCALECCHFRTHTHRWHVLCRAHSLCARMQRATAPAVVNWSICAVPKRMYKFRDSLLGTSRARGWCNARILVSCLGVCVRVCFHA